MILEEWIWKYMSDEVFMLYKSMNETWNDSCELDHISVK
jgi:hypothetical protein